MAQGREELSLLPERTPSKGPRSTAAVKSSPRPCLAAFPLIPPNTPLTIG
jgi:hypothetical protein